MSQDRKSETKSKNELGFELDPAPELLMQYYEHALKIPIMHLVNQFLNPGIPDRNLAAAKVPLLIDLKDEKSADLSKVKNAEPSKMPFIDLDNLTPNLTREEAFGRLDYRLRREALDSGVKDFTRWLQNLQTRASPLSNHEKIIFAMALFMGFGVTQNINKSFQHLNSPELQNNGYAVFLVGFYYKKGWGTEINLEKAFYLISKAIELSDLGYAYNEKARMYEEGLLLKADNKAAFQNYVSSAQRNDLSGLYHLAICYATGDCETPINLPKAAEYFSKSIMQGYHFALSQYARFILLRFDSKQALSFLQKALNTSGEYGYVQFTSALQLGDMLSTVDGVDQDIALAAYYYRLACVKDQGNDSSIRRLYRDYENKMGSGDIKNSYQYYAVTYHHMMATDSPDDIARASACYPLWCADLDSKWRVVKAQMLKMALNFFPPHVAQPPRIRANLALHYFQQETAEGFKTALSYLKDLTLVELTPEENYDLGFWLHSSLIEHGNLDRYGLICIEAEQAENKLFSNPLWTQAEACLTIASEQGHVDAKRLLAQIKTNLIAPSPDKQSQGAGVSDAKPSLEILMDSLRRKAGKLSLFAVKDVKLVSRVCLSLDEKECERVDFKKN